MKEALDVRHRRVPFGERDLNDDVIINDLIEKISVIERERRARR
ncbi:MULTISPECIES: hypothetical protein [unclassified Bradyrhizobium]|nr:MULTISPECIES: hypothetical protein [unclassified Bradyrhizobium]